jgi:hypothetical protein
MGAVETAGLRAERRPTRKSHLPYPDKSPSGAGTRLRAFRIRLAGFLFFEKPLQVETADGRGGGVETPAHLNLLP